MTFASSYEVDLFPLDEDHIDAAASLYMATFNGPPWNDGWNLRTAKERLTEICRSSGYIGFVLINRERGEVCALAAGAFESWHDGKHFQIKELCVHPDLQRRGLGKKILDAITKEAFDNGAKKIYLFTSRQGAAEKLYAKKGFRERPEIVMILSMPTE